MGFRLWVDSVKLSKRQNKRLETIACFGLFAIIKSLEHINGVTEMKQQIVVINQVGTGSAMVLQSRLNAHFDMWELQEWHVGPLDAPQTIPAGSSIRDEDQYLDDVCNVPSLVVRGW